MHTPTPHYWDITTEQTATVIKTLYPRPRPGDGKNEVNYQCAGCTVTVLSKHVSLKGIDMWMCVSGRVTDHGNAFNLDHVWINTRWLDSNSYNLDLVPYDPNYLSPYFISSEVMKNNKNK